MTSRIATPEEKSAALERLFEISDILDTGLDKESIAILKQMCDQGINPQALAQVVKFLRKASSDAADASTPSPES